MVLLQFFSIFFLTIGKFDIFLFKITKYFCNVSVIQVIVYVYEMQFSLQIKNINASNMTESN